MPKVARRDKPEHSGTPVGIGAMVGVPLYGPQLVRERVVREDVLHPCLEVATQQVLAHVLRGRGR